MSTQFTSVLVFLCLVLLFSCRPKPAIDPSKYTLTVAQCNRAGVDTWPRDLEVYAFYFAPEMNGDDALEEVASENINEPSQVFHITKDQFDSQGQFQIKVDAGVVVVLLLQANDKDGTDLTSYTWLETKSGHAGAICIEYECAGCARKPATKADFIFSVRDAGDGDYFNARLRGDVWYFDPQTPNEDIYSFFGEPTQNNDWNPRPSRPNATLNVRNEVSPGHYQSNPSAFRRRLKANQKIAIVWHFLDARNDARPNYRHPLYIYQPQEAGKITSTILSTDRFRAGLRVPTKASSLL